MEILEIVVQSLFRTSRKPPAFKISYMCHFEPPGGGEKLPIKFKDRKHEWGCSLTREWFLEAVFKGFDFQRSALRLAREGGFLAALEIT